MANNGINNFGPAVLAKFERIAQYDKNKALTKGGARQELIDAKASKDMNQIRALVNRTRHVTVPNIQDSTQLSPEALEIMRQYTK